MAKKVVTGTLSLEEAAWAPWIMELLEEAEPRAWTPPP